MNRIAFSDGWVRSRARQATSTIPMSGEFEVDPVTAPGCQHGAAGGHITGDDRMPGAGGKRPKAPGVAPRSLASQ